MAASPPTVLQVLPALVTGGVERGTLEIAEALVGAGWRALVASSGGPMVARLEALGARHVTLPLNAKDPLTLWRNAAALAALARREAVGIIHARSRAPAWSALLAARRSGARFVTTYHGTYNEGFPGKRLYNSVMARGERVIAISGFIAEHLRAIHGTEASRIRLIPRGVDARLFDPALVTPARVAALRAAWGVPDGRPVALLPARLTRWKGQGVLVQAMARLLAGEVWAARQREAAAAAGTLGHHWWPPPAPFALLVGGDQGREGFRRELEEQIRAAGLGGDVAIAGHAEDMPAALRLADVVVHASTDPEAFGRTVIEAQAMGRMVIASDLGAPRETVTEGKTGWLVPAGDADALAEALLRALLLPASERAALEARARQAVLDHYTTAAMQQATLAVYRELL
jgi:glycosyltransferase involved in cell wall biosynthesis